MLNAVVGLLLKMTINRSVIREGLEIVNEVGFDNRTISKEFDYLEALYVNMWICVAYGHTPAKNKPY